jgi:hypothetical protein
MQDVFRSGVYIKSLCIQAGGGYYEASRLNCVNRGMQLYQLDSAEANATVLDAATKGWTDRSWYGEFYVQGKNGTGCLYYGNVGSNGIVPVSKNIF